MKPKRLQFSVDDFAEDKPLDEGRGGKASQRAVQNAAGAEGFTSRGPSVPKIDGRTLRKTNRNFQLNISVSAETKDQFWEQASINGFSTGGEFLQSLLTMWEGSATGRRG